MLHWRRTQLDIDQHVIVINNRLDKSGNFMDEPQGFTTEQNDDDEEAAVNQYVADLSVNSPSSTDKPLWEILLLMARKYVVFRIHHALGDGFSLMFMLMAGCGKVDDHQDAVSTVVPVKTAEIKGGKRRDWLWLLGVFWGFFKMVRCTLMFVIGFVVRSLFVCDEETVISGGDGVELWPRKLATAKFLPEDMKEVKKAIPNTISNKNITAP